MNKLHEKLLQLLKEIDDICKKNNIVYYAAGGTTIGAVRHKGFIPWDDDADLYMTRDNFYKFKEAVEREHPKNRALECLDDNEEYPGTIPRYMDTTTSIVARYHTLNTCAAGILIDIFILDPVPNDYVLQLEHIGKLNVYADLIMPYYGYSQRMDEKYMHMYHMYKKRIQAEGHQKVIKQMEEELFNHKEEDCDYYILRWGTLTHIFEKSLFGDPVYFKFENMEIALPSRWYDYLVQLYGPQWMYIPSHIEDEKHAFIVDTQYTYANYMEDAKRFIQKEDAYECYIKRKAALIQREIYERPLKNQLMSSIAAYVLLSQKKYLEKNSVDVEALYYAHQYKEVVKAFKPYMTYQFSTLFIGAMRHGEIYRFNHKIFIELEDKQLNMLIYALLVVGELKKARLLMDLRKSKGEMPEELDCLDKKIKLVFDINKAYYCKQYEMAESLVAEMAHEDVKNILTVFKIKIALLLKNGVSVENNLLDKMSQYPEDGELMKLFGDFLFEKGKTDDACVYYKKAIPLLTNGLYLLDIQDRVDVEVNYDTPSGNSMLTELQQKQLDLLKEIDKICKQNGIKYFVFGNTLLHGYYRHMLNGEYKTNVIAMLPEDAMKFIKLMEMCPIENRNIDYPLNNPLHNGHNIYYCDKNTLSFDWSKSKASKDVGIHITINILKRKHDNAIKWKWIRLLDAVQTIYYKSIENKYRDKAFWGHLFTAPIMRIIGKKRIAKIIFEGYIQGASNISDKKFYLSKNNYKHSVGKQYSPEHFRFTGVVDICGYSFCAPCDTEKFMYDVFGKYAEENLRVTGNQPMLMKVADCNMSYKEFEENMDLSVLLTGDWDNYKKGQACNKQVIKLNKQIASYWNILLRGEDRFKLFLKYRPVKEKILRLYEENEFECLEEILKEYDKRVRYYLSKNMGLCIDKDILNVYIAMLENAGEKILAEKLLKKIPEEHLEEIEII